MFLNLTIRKAFKQKSYASLMKERLIEYWRNRGIIKDENLIQAFKETPRENFISSEFVHEAYGDYPLPLTKGQTISQPTTVMIMIDALKLKKTDKVLEVGAGSGWCAAIMSRLCKQVVTTEIIPELADFAKNNIKNMKIKNVKIVKWDGSNGYEKEQPYDKIMVTAACPELPPPLIKQLKENGILLAPVGSLYSQNMIRAVKKKSKIYKENLGGFMFVPLRGEYGYKE